MSGWFTLFTNCRYVLDGGLVEDHLVISDETGLILKREGYIGGEAVDLEDAIIAPGFLELHTNGANGFHFTHFEDKTSYANKIDDIAKYYTAQGVTGFWATLPTIKGDEFQKAYFPSVSQLHARRPTNVLIDPPFAHSTGYTPSSFAPGRACRRALSSSFEERGTQQRPFPTLFQLPSQCLWIFTTPVRCQTCDRCSRTAGFCSPDQIIDFARY